MQKRLLHLLLLLLALVFGPGAAASPGVDHQADAGLQASILHLPHQQSFEQVGLVEVPEHLNAKEENASWDKLMKYAVDKLKKAGKSHSEIDVYKEIIESSQRARPKTNKDVGIVGDL